MKVKFFILLLFLIYVTILQAQIKNNYFGFNLIYNSAQLKNPSSTGNGFGGDMYYQTFFDNHFSCSFLVEFLYNTFSNKFSDTISYPITGTVNYTRMEKFYNIAPGLLFNCDLFQGNFSPYLVAGTIFGFVYKSYEYSYENSGTDLAGISKPNQWLPTAFIIPVGVGVHLKIGNNSVINLNSTYMLFLWDKTVVDYGYENILNFKVGYM